MYCTVHTCSAPTTLRHRGLPASRAVASPGSSGDQGEKTNKEKEIVKKIRIIKALVRFGTGRSVWVFFRAASSEHALTGLGRPSPPD